MLETINRVTRHAIESDNFNITNSFNTKFRISNMVLQFVRLSIVGQFRRTALVPVLLPGTFMKHVLSESSPSSLLWIPSFKIFSFILTSIHYQVFIVVLCHLIV